MKRTFIPHKWNENVAWVRNIFNVAIHQKSILNFVIILERNLLRMRFENVNSNFMSTVAELFLSREMFVNRKF